VEDGHWLDPSSQELLDLLVAALARRRIFVLCTARPGFRHSWTDYTYFHQVAVAPLADADTTALLHDLLLPATASAALTALIRERTGGNPFFVEELVRALQAHELLTLHGRVYEVGAAARGTLPPSIQGIVQARLDRLPGEAKHLLQVAAIIGPTVLLTLLQAGVEWPEDVLHKTLTHLQAAELLYETHTVLGHTYTFKHALIQDTAYQSLLRSTRQPCHQRIAHVLETRFPGTAAT
jgi:predicted ATPase